MQATVYDQTGKEIEKISLNAAIFGVEPHAEIVHQALVRQLANARQANAHTKDRSDVRGGGRKPHRQKGTGRARHGSKRSPIFIGGGVTFGPTNERNYSKRMPKKQRRLALFSVLATKGGDNKILVLDKYEDKDAKTKGFAELVSKLPVSRNALVVSSRDSKSLLQRVSGNIPNVKTIITQYLNIADLLKYDSVIFLKDALVELESTFLTNQK